MKKIISCVLVLALCVGMSLTISNSVKAADLSNENCFESSLEASGSPKGIYLGSGSSSVSKAGSGRVTAGGTTIGRSVVSSISVNVRVERLVNGSWQIYTSWSATRNNAASVSSSKTLSVPTGYYYRTHCFHAANSDASSSVSGSVWI